MSHQYDIMTYVGMEEDVVNVATLGFLDRPGHDALCFKSQELFLTRYHCHSSAEQIRSDIHIILLLAMPQTVK